MRASRTWAEVATLAVAAATVQAGVIDPSATRRDDSTYNSIESCNNLPGIIDQLLAAGEVAGNEPMVASNLFSAFYPAGTNPDANELFSHIPMEAFGPTDDRDGAISSSDGWNQTAVIADQGYGEQAGSSVSQQGGLPAFCRFGGQVQTSESGSKTLFEVWMPLPDDTAAASPGQNGASTSRRHLKRQNEGDDVSLDQLKEKANAAAAAFQPADPSGWKKRLAFMVGGALRGTAHYPDMKQTMARYRVAVAGTNMGHFGAATGTKWMPGNPEAWTDFAHRAAHLSTIVSQLSVKTFYGVHDIAEGDLKGRRSGLGFYSYFRGCSTGGRAAMAEVQRYPEDFDGVLAGSPGFDYNHLKAAQVHVSSWLQNQTSPSFVPTLAYPLINKAVLQSCDAQDGVVDNVVSLPFQCQPDFASLIGCTALGLQPYTATGTDAPPSASSATVAPNCLTDAQLETVKNIYTDYYVEGEFIRQAVLPGSEFAWTVTNAVTSTASNASPQWFQYQVLGETVWNDTSFDPYTRITPDVIRMGQEMDPGGTITFNPDISAFVNNGAKLIHYHGLADPLITSGASTQYYEKVKDIIGDDIDSSYKYYLIPGMNHCRGGTGAWNFGGASQSDDAGGRPLQYDPQHDMFLALIDWVENGQSPDVFTGAAYKTAKGGSPPASGVSTAFGNGVLNTRALCPYPKIAQLTGRPNADRSKAEAFECVWPQDLRRTPMP